MATLKQSTTYTRVFLMVQSSDHISALTGASPSVNLSKSGGAFAAAGGTVTEISSGWYKVALTTTDTNTVGDLAYHITAASGDPTDFSDQVSATILGDSVTVGTNNDKTGYALTSGERTSVADALLDRDMSTGTDSGSPSVRTVRQALRFNRNKVSVAAGTMTVTKEDDSTASWTATLTTDAAALPIITVDPA